MKNLPNTFNDGVGGAGKCIAQKRDQVACENNGIRDCNALR